MLAFAEKQCKNSLNNIFKLLKINLFSMTHMAPLEQRVADQSKSFTGANEDDFPNPLVSSLVR